MPQNVFRLFVVGLLFQLLAYAPSQGWRWGYWIIGAALVVCAFLAWIAERRESHGNSA